MNKKHERPPNGPGNNGLRGGPKNYSNKTAVGTWLEEWGGPQFYQRGFSTEDFTTEGQHQQIGATLKEPAYYGAGLPNYERFKNPVKNSDVFSPSNGPGSNTWISNTKDMAIQMFKVKLIFLIIFDYI